MNAIRKNCSWCFALAACAMAVATPAWPAFGDRDCSFAVGGVHTFQYTGFGPYSPVYAFSEEASGSVLARVGLTSAGSSIYRMDGDGSTSTTISATFAYGVVDPADTLLANGKFLNANGLGLGPSFPPGVRQSLAAGPRDTTFGTDGYATIAGFTSASTRPLVQSDGRIVAGGVYNNAAAIVRFNADGSVDATFGASGVVAAHPSVGPTVYSIALQSDDRILVLGPYNLVRYMPDGTLDPSFGSGGSILLSGVLTQALRVRLQPSGKILVLGTKIGLRLARFDSAGNLDTTAAGGAGYRDLTFPPPATLFNDTDALTPLDVMADGRPLVVGTLSSSGNGTGAMIRYGVDLTDDASIPLDFSPGGVKALANGKVLVGRTGYNMLPEARRFLADADASTCIATSTTVSSSPNPSTYGQSVTFTATVTPISSPPAQGTVQFRVSGTNIGTPVTLVNGVATLDTSALPDGANAITAIYVAAGTFTGSTSAPYSHTVTPRLATTTTMSSSPNPSNSGDPVTLTATVVLQSGPGTPVGTVQFKDGSTFVGSPVALGSGSASLVTSALQSGTRQLTAVYSGDSTFMPSTSATSPHQVRSQVTAYPPGGTTNTAQGSSDTYFSVGLNAASTTTVTVDYATVDHTALAGADYVPKSGTLTFAPGETFKSVSVTVLGKTTPHPQKDFFFVLSNPVGATISSQGSATGVIYYADQSSQQSIYIDDLSIAEGYSGVTLAGFTVSLSRFNSGTVTVQYATANGTAQAGVDYVTQSGTLTFQPGRPQQWVMVPVQGNATVDGNRTFVVMLSNPTGGAVIAKGNGTGTIVDDDPTPAASTVPMYRLYSNVTKEHLYTTDANEYAVLGTQNWVQEGIGYTLFASAGSYGAQYGVPLYRMYHPGIRQHHWTTDSNEVMVLAAQGQWQYERIPGYVLPAAGSGTTPLYRLMYASPPLHLWTTDLNEKNVLSTQYGWTYEGVVGEVLP